MAFDLKKSPGHLLRRAQQFANDQFSKEVGASPTPRQFEVLHTVSKNEGLSQTDLVRATGIDRSTLADMIARMIRGGLLSRSRTKEDARANAVSITAAGKRVLAGASASVDRAEAAALNVLPKSQQGAFMKSLAAYAAALDAMAEAPAAAPKKAGKTAKKATKARAKARPAKRKAAKRR